MKRFCSTLLLCAVLLTLPGAALAPDGAQAVTRGELTQMLNQTFGLYTSIGATLTDLTPESPYYYDLLTAVRVGYLSGYPDGTARPEQAVTRLEAAVLISGLLQLPEAAEVAFTDAVPAWGLDSARRVCAAGILSPGADGAFDPDGPLTQEQAGAALAALETQKPAPLWSQTILDIPTYDGHSFQGRLCLPQGEETVDKVVVYINGTGPNTYLNQRQSAPYRFLYFDYFADNFAQQGTAFFSYNTRGIQLSDTAPFYTIDWDVYGAYTPQVIAKDVASMVEQLRMQPALKDAEIYLLGWSEGAIIAPLAVANEGVEVDALLLAGYPNDNMQDILKWQLDGPQTFFLYTIYFDALGSDQVTKEQYQADPYGVLTSLFGGVSFEDTDVNGNGVIDLGDFTGNLRAQMHTQLLAAVEAGDTQWIRENFMELPAGWFQEHFKLGTTGDILSQITQTPIHIFHGTYDLNCPVQGVYDVQAQFEQLGLKNLTVEIFEGHNHDLNYDYWLATGQDSEGCLHIFDTVARLGA